MANFASLNLHIILGVGQLTSTKFGALVEPHGIHFGSKHDRIGQSTFAVNSTKCTANAPKIGIPGEFGAP